MKVTEICFITLISILDAYIETSFVWKDGAMAEGYAKRRDAKLKKLLDARIK